MSEEIAPHLVSIVVVGGMNPRLHHPAWYQAIGAIDSDEMDEAVAFDQTVVTPQASQLQFSGITVVCVPERWEVRSSIASNKLRMHGLMLKVFDDNLHHTPVSAVGFNFHYRFESEAEVQLIRRVGDLFPAGGIKAATLTMVGQATDQRLQVQLQQPSEERLSAQFNFEYRVTTDAGAEDSGFFHLADVAPESRLVSDNDEADSHFSNYIQSLGTMDGGD